MSNYETKLAGSVARNKVRAKSMMFMIAHISRINQLLLQEDLSALRYEIRMLVGVYEKHPKEFLDPSLSKQIGATLKAAGYSYNPDWRKSSTPYTSILVSKE